MFLIFIFFFASILFSFFIQGWGWDDEDGDAVQLQEHLQRRANRSAEAWHLEVYQVYQISQTGQLEVYFPHQRLWRLEPRPWGHLWRVHKLWKRAPCQPESLQPALWPFHRPPWRGFQPKNFQSNSTWYFTYFIAPEHFTVIIILFQHNLAEEEPERAALMAERLMELGATVVIKCLCSILFCTI